MYMYVCNYSLVVVFLKKFALKILISPFKKKSTKTFALIHSPKTEEEEEEELKKNLLFFSSFKEDTRTITKKKKTTTTHFKRENFYYS